MSLLLEKPETADQPSIATGSVLELEDVRKLIFPVSVEAYHLMAENQPTELLRGIIIKKLSKSPKHRAKGYRIARILSRQITSEFLLFQEAPITTADSEPEPDVLIVRGTEAEFEERHPTTAELIVEVAVTSLKLDRVKASIYAEAGVKEYWIVRPETRQVEIFRQPTATGYVETLVATAPAVVLPVALPGVSVDLGELFA